MQKVILGILIVIAIAGGAYYLGTKNTQPDIHPLPTDGTHETSRELDPRVDSPFQAVDSLSKGTEPKSVSNTAVAYSSPYGYALEYPVSCQKLPTPKQEADTDLFLKCDTLSLSVKHLGDNSNWTFRDYLSDSGYSQAPDPTRQQEVVLNVYEVVNGIQIHRRVISEKNLGLGYLYAYIYFQTTGPEGSKPVGVINYSKPGNSYTDKELETLSQILSSLRN